MQKNIKNGAGLVCILSSAAISIFPPAKLIALISFIIFWYLTWLEYKS